MSRAETSTTQSKMQVTTTKFDVLGHEFTLDELNDIANHGMSAGVSGFIYSSELHDVYEKYENNIMDYLDEHAFDLGEKNGFRMVLNSMDRRGIEYDSLQIFKEQAVWMFVELFAVQLLQRNNHPDWV